MNPQWHFNERRPSDRVRDTANDAFFTAESLENLSEALVREGTQNSLDAAQRGDGHVRQVRVRIRFVPQASLEARHYLANLFSPARRNFEAGLGKVNLDKLFGEDCGYLIFEDFHAKSWSLIARLSRWLQNCITMRQQARLNAVQDRLSEAPPGASLHCSISSILPGIFTA